MTRFWRYFVSNGRGSRGCRRLGIRGHAVPLLPSLARRLQLGQFAGVEVWKVQPGGPANQAGIRVGDILVSLAGQPAGSVARLNRMVRALPHGLPVGVVWIRRESRMDGRLAPGAACLN